MSPYIRPPESWPRKFAVAVRGILLAVRTQRSFWVHLPVAVVVLVGATLHGVTRVEWAILLVCITMVLAAEAFNTALEFLAKAITQEENENIRHALDVASGAVLITSLGALAVGSLLLLTRLAADIQRWLE
jgi:diacylglycerol kinase